MKKFLLLFVLVFAVSLMFGAALSEGFETWPPTDWTIVQPAGSPTNDITQSNTYAYSGTYSARFSSYSSGSPYDEYMITPQLVTTGGDQTVSFWYRRYSWGSEVFKVGWSSTGTNVSTDFTWSAEISDASTTWQQYSKTDLPVGTKYVAIHYYSNYMYYLYIDDFAGPEIYVPAFANPTNLSTSSITQTTASLDWSPGGAETLWDVEYGASGYTQGTGTTITDISSHPYALNPPLTAGTAYDWYVRANYGSGNYSDWAGPEDFTTLYAPVTSFPYSESFDGTTFAPSGWGNTKTAGTGNPGIWDRQTTGSNPTCSPYSGAAMARFNCYSLSSGTTAELTTLPINFPGDDYRVKFWMYRDTGYASNAELVNVYYNTSNTSVGATLLGTVNRSTSLDPVVASAGWYEYTYTMPAGAGGDGRYIIFEGVSAYGNNIFFDEVTIEAIPAGPVFSVNPTSKDFGTVNVGSSSAAQTFTIENTGGGTLTITGVSKTGTNENQFTLTDLNSYPHDLTAGQSITVDVAFAPTSVGAKTADLSVESSAKVTHNAALTGDGWNVNHGGGGAAQGNYFFANSLATGAPSYPTYDWIDYATHTEIITWTTGSDDDGYFQIPDIGFDFTFFGNTYRTADVYIGANGLVTFGASGSGYGAAIPSASAPNNLIAGCWMDLDDRSDGQIFYGGDSSHFVITYYHYHDYGDDTEWMTFQIILYANGNIKLQFNDTESTIDATSTSTTVNGDACIGIENAAGDAGIQYRNNGEGGPIFGSDLAIAFGLDDSSLPVSLSSFTAVYEDAPVLHWTTQSESDNLGWNVYRGMFENGYQEEDYIQINTELIPGMGNCTEPTDYTFVDEYPVVEGTTYWYWLESVSTTNQVDFYGPISLEIPIQGEIPNIVLETTMEPNFPNPFNPRTTIKFSIAEGEKGTLSIYNIKGQIIVSEKFDTGEFRYEWNADKVSSGIYFYKLTTPSKEINRKMILLK